MTALPVRVEFAACVASLDAAFVRTEPLLTEGRHWLIWLLGIFATAVEANLRPFAALPPWIILT